MDFLTHALASLAALVALINALVDAANRFGSQPGAGSGGETVRDLARTFLLLAFIPAIFGFVALMDRRDKTNRERVELIASQQMDSLLRVTPTASHHLVYKARAAVLLNLPNVRDSILNDVVTLSLRQGAPDLAVFSAAQMSGGNDKTSALARIIGFQLEYRDYPRAFNTVVLMNRSDQSEAAEKIIRQIRLTGVPSLKQEKAKPGVVADHTSAVNPRQ
jgi:hypothetical protein